MQQTAERHHHGALDIARHLKLDGKFIWIYHGLAPIYYRMTHEWDWPPPRRRKFYRTITVYQPSHVYQPLFWRVMITIIKALLAIPLSILAIGSFWLIWILI